MLTPNFKILPFPAQSVVSNIIYLKVKENVYKENTKMPIVLFFHWFLIVVKNVENHRF